MKIPLKYTAPILGLALAATSANAALVARFDLGDPQDLAIAPAGELAWADVNSSNFNDPVASNGVTLTITGTLQGWRQRSFTPDPGANYAVVRDFVFNDNVSATATFTFTGLTANEEYNINFWSYDNTGNNRTSTWSVTGGGSIGVDFTGGNAQQTPYLLTGTADGTGSLAVSVSDRWRLNGFELSVIPESTTALLGGLGFLALLRRRR